MQKSIYKSAHVWMKWQFSKSFKIVNFAPNQVLNSDKNRYRMFEPESNMSHPNFEAKIIQN